MVHVVSKLFIAEGLFCSQNRFTLMKGWMFQKCFSASKLIHQMVNFSEPYNPIIILIFTRGANNSGGRCIHTFAKICKDRTNVEGMETTK